MNYVEYGEEQRILDGILLGWFNFYNDCDKKNEEDLKRQSSQIIKGLIRMKIETVTKSILGT